MEQLPSISILQVLSNRKTIQKNPLPFHHDNFERLGNTFVIPVPMEGRVIFSRDPEIIKQVLQKKHRSFEKSKLQSKDLAKYIGHGLLTSNGDHWRTHRRLVQPAFHQKKLKGLFEIMQRAITDELDRIPTNSQIDVLPKMGDLAFQVVAKTLFSNNDIREPMAELKRITEVNQNMLVKEMRKPYFKWWLNLSGEIKRHLKLSDRAREILNQLVEDRLLHGSQGDDLLDMLLTATYEDGTHMPRRQLLDELMILFTAGFETTASALSFALYFLAKDPQLQEQLFKEVQELGTETYTWEDLGKLRFIASCIKEAMRLYPPAYFIDRVTTEPVEINGIQLKEGTMILLSIFELHRNKEFWEDPLEFKGNRFMEIDAKAHSDYYYPFGAGPRMCIGNAMATYEMTMSLVEIVKRFRISTEMDGIDINPLITMKPTTVPLTFMER